MPIAQVSISKRIEECYITYAREVNAYRALPFAYDGFKPVQRRLLFNGARIARSAFAKSAALIGETLANHHPHGDTSLYSSLVGLVNDRYPLFVGQGNWGRYGTQPAAMRYTSVKLSDFAKDVYLPFLSFGETYINDLDHVEHLYVPTIIPYALINGTSGIGVGIKTKIPSFTLESVRDYVEWLLSPSGRSEPELTVNWPRYDIDSSLLSEGKGRIIYHVVCDREQESHADQFAVSQELPDIPDTYEFLCAQLEKEIEAGKLFIRNESGKGRFRIVIGNNRNLRINALEARLKNLTYTVTYYMSWSLGEQTTPVAKVLSPRQVLELCLEKYEYAIGAWKAEELGKIQRDLLFHAKKFEISKLLGRGKTWPEIQKQLKLTSDEIAYIRSRSVGQLSSEYDPTPELLQTKARIESVSLDQLVRQIT